MSTPAVRLVWNCACLLGEGPVWLADEAALRFVDIHSGRLHRYHPASGACETQEIGGMPSFIVPAAKGGFLVGSQHEIWHLDSDGRKRCIATIDQPASNRTNDAAVDVQGRLWFGTMDNDEVQPTGVLYCLDADGLHAMGGEAVVTNGPAITPDGTALYHVDSANRRICRYVIGDGPALVQGEIFLQLTEADGYPDGVTLDSEDCLWVALWDGGAVRRYAPDGSLLMTIDLPCSRVTKIAFGGPDLKTAYVTTARVGLDADTLANQSLAGGVFAFDAPAAGNLLPQTKI